MCRYGVFKVHVGGRPRENAQRRGRSLKTQQHAVEVDILLGELVFRTAEAINGRVATGVIAPESLERR